MSYPFRTTFRQDSGTYIEDRGYPHSVRQGDAGWEEVDAEFGTILAIGQTAVRSADDEGWDVQNGCPMLEDARARRLEALRTAWLEAEKEAVVETAGGWLADADERANRDLEGLITSMEASGVEDAAFCGADNVLRTVSLQELRQMRLLVIAHAQALYARKWELRTALEQAQTFDALDAVQISFEGV